MAEILISTLVKIYVHVTTGIFESRENSLVVPWYQLQVTIIVNTDNSFQNGFAKKKPIQVF